MTPPSVTLAIQRIHAALPAGLIALLLEFKAHGKTAWVVGGCLRDVLLDKNAADWDLATNALPHEVQAMFPRTLPTGLQHGTVTVLYKRLQYEVTTLRGEVGYTDGRRPDHVVFLNDIEADLARRDFTVNAVAYDPLTKSLHDPFHGLHDLDVKILRSVGDPSIRFKEDALRMLRAARFSSTLTFDIAKDAMEAMKALASNIKGVSQERILVEWQKGMAASNPCRMLQTLFDTGVLGHILPEFDLSAFEHLAARIALHPDVHVRNAIFFSGCGSAMSSTLARWKFPNQNRFILMHLATFLSGRKDDITFATTKDVRVWLSKVGRKHAAQVIQALYRENITFPLQWCQEELERDAPLSIDELPVNGHDVMEVLHIPPSIGIKHTLQALLEHVLARPEDATREMMLNAMIHIHEQRATAR